jgi:hypothetical protein
VVIGTTTANHEFDVYQSNNTAIGLTTTDPALTVTNGGSTLGNGSTVAFQGVDTAGTEITLARISDVSTSLTAGSASGNLAFYTRNAGTQQQDLTILSGGNVGIATSSPLGRLSVTGVGTGSGYTFIVSNSNFTPLFNVQDNGNVGIGTTTPVGKLVVIGQDVSAGPTLSLRQGGSGTNFGYDFGISQGATPYLGLYAVNGGAGNLALAISRTTSNVGIGTTSPLARLDVAGANNGTTPLFQLSSGASFATTTQFIVPNNGSVGIGTTSPYSKLTI